MLKVSEEFAEVEFSNFPEANKNHFHKLAKETVPAFQKVLADEWIDPTLSHRLESVYLPIAAWLAEKHKNQLLVVGLNGAQGSGKSMLAKMLQCLLVNGFDKQVQILSIDDIYLLKEERLQFAKTVHPLFRTRGVPGTHDVQLGLDVIARFRQQTSALVSLPRFDKGSDQRVPEQDWPQVKAPVDILIFEGWCVGAKPQADHELEEPVNELEREEDTDGSWRRAVNQALANDYQRLFAEIDVLMMMSVPGVQQILEWRSLQEQKLKKRGARSTMNDAELRRFILLNDRITQALWAEMPARADLVLEIDKTHQIRSVRAKKK